MSLFWTASVPLRSPQPESQKKNNVQGNLTCFGNCLLGEQSTYEAFLPVFWNAAYRREVSLLLQGWLRIWYYWRKPELAWGHQFFLILLILFVIATPYDETLARSTRHSWSFVQISVLLAFIIQCLISIFHPFRHWGYGCEHSWWKLPPHPISTCFPQNIIAVFRRNIQVSFVGASPFWRSEISFHKFATSKRVIGTRSLSSNTICTPGNRKTKAANTKVPAQVGCTCSSPAAWSMGTYNRLYSSQAGPCKANLLAPQASIVGQCARNSCSKSEHWFNFAIRWADVTTRTLSWAKMATIRMMHPVLHQCWGNYCGL